MAQYVFKRNSIMKHMDLFSLLQQAEKEIKRLKTYLSPSEKEIEDENDVRDQLSDKNISFEDYMKNLDNLANTLMMLLDEINKETYRNK